MHKKLFTYSDNLNAEILLGARLANLESRVQMSSYGTTSTLGPGP